MKRTLLAVGVAVLVSMMFVPCDQWGFWGWQGPQPFWIASEKSGYLLEWLYVSSKLILQTIFLAVAAAVIVNLFPRRPRK
jgi:hypothetical protein